jgi:hypothetical protein
LISDLPATSADPRFLSLQNLLFLWFVVSGSDFVVCGLYFFGSDFADYFQPDQLARATRPVLPEYPADLLPSVNIAGRE